MLIDNAADLSNFSVKKKKVADCCTTKDMDNRGHQSF